MPSSTQAPNFESQAFLKQHVQSTLDFYAPNAFDPLGGFFHYFLDDGSVYDRNHRHLVSATRFVFNWCMAFAHDPQDRYRQWAAHALAHLKSFRRPNGLHAWTLSGGEVEDGSIMAYGQAFVLLAHSHAHRIGLSSAQAVRATFDQMNHAFYSEADQAYADEINSEGVLIDYRGQNANMHMCEACLAAYESTADTVYLERAQSLIERFAFDLADKAGGLVWEHYRTDWSIDWDYNRDNPGNIFKPWGFQTGHQTEWAKLLLISHAHRPQQRYLDRAIALHQAAYAHGWDQQHGGLIYGFDPERRPCDRDKYFWVQAESFASAWRLWRATGEQVFRQQYHDTWAWSWEHLVDHHYGAWFRIVGPDGRKLETTKSPAGKTDYHTMGACWDVLHVGGVQA